MQAASAAATSTPETVPGEVEDAPPARGGGTEVSPAANGDNSVAWPDESAETAFLAESGEKGELPSAAAGVPAMEVETRQLPSMEELVARIPPDVREGLDGLFRARFVRVVRIPAQALRS